MFLNRLKKKEKQAFLELAHHIARSDNDFSQSQKDIIKAYCQEMKIEDIKYSEKKFNIKKVLNKIKTPTSQKIALLEIMALVYSDSYLHAEEEKVLVAMVEAFNLSYSDTIIYGEWTKAMLALYNQGRALVEL
jgi:tellurite resistance protein